MSKKNWLKWLWRLEILFPISAREDNVGDSEKDVQSDWVSVWLLLVAKRVFANLRDSSQCGKPVKPSGSVCQSQRTRKKSSHPTLLRKYCQVIKQIQPPYRRKYWRFCKINQVDHFPFLLSMGKICHFWGQKRHFRRSNQNSRPLTNIPLEI